MRVFENFSEWISFRRGGDLAGQTIGFVPTMGALHEGHIELVRRSKKENRKTVVSIFVNPTQFNDPKDFEKYPNTFEADQAKLREAGADFLIYPTPATAKNQLYPDQFRYFVDEKQMSTILCGAHRAGHFRGVLTVVMKLLNGVDADRAYFGEKDYQQMTLIQGMTEAFFMKTQIVPCSTVREKDGLAMSSRNARLSAIERETAPRIHAALRSGKPLAQVRQDLERDGFKVEYLEEHWGRRFIAAYLGDVRLIDNVQV
jgi:pantoate--beta-alanine ligase